MGSVLFSMLSLFIMVNPCFGEADLEITEQGKDIAKQSVPAAQPPSDVSINFAVYTQFFTSCLCTQEATFLYTRIVYQPLCSTDYP